MKIVLAGAGEVGSHLAKMLSFERHEIVVIDESEERLDRASEGADIITIQGHPTSIATLVEAGVASADLFIAVSPAHEQDVNLVSALLAKKLGAKKVRTNSSSQSWGSTPFSIRRRSLQMRLSIFSSRQLLRSLWTTRTGSSRWYLSEWKMVPLS